MNCDADAQGPYDTIVVPGGSGLQDTTVLAALISWLDDEAPAARRIASICTGVYVAAAAGRLNGARATIHWDAAGQFSRLFPEVRLEPDRIVVRDGSLWSCAGVSAGIDLALALIVEDLGERMSRLVARQLVVPFHRLGGQLQYSSILSRENSGSRFSGLITWISENLSHSLKVDDLAQKMAMSPRNFARAFRLDTGLTPAKAVEHLRLEAARLSVEDTRKPIDQIADMVGFRDPERMRRAFIRAFGQSPQALRRTAAGRRSHHT